MTTIDYTDVPMPDADLASHVEDWQRIARLKRSLTGYLDDDDRAVAHGKAAALTQAAGIVCAGADRAQLAADAASEIEIADEFHTGADRVGRLAGWRHVLDTLGRLPLSRAYERERLERLEREERRRQPTPPAEPAGLRGLLYRVATRRPRRRTSPHLASDQ